MDRKIRVMDKKTIRSWMLKALFDNYGTDKGTSMGEGYWPIAVSEGVPRTAGGK